jgi:hypothetical protein
MNKTMKLNDLKKQFPNNYYLGEYVRHNYYEIKDLIENIKDIVNLYPNNFVLGEKIRTL